MPEAEAAVMRAPAKRRISRLGARAVITRLIAWPALLTRPVAGRPHAIRRGLLAVVAVSACAAVVTGIAVHTGTHAGSDPTQSTQSAAAIASLDRLSGTSLHITLRPAQRSRTRTSKAHTNRVRRPRSHPTLVSRATAVAARYTTPPTRPAAQPARQRRRSKAARQRAHAARAEQAPRPVPLQLRRAPDRPLPATRLRRRSAPAASSDQDLHPMDDAAGITTRRR